MYWEFLYFVYFLEIKYKYLFNNYFYLVFRITDLRDIRHFTNAK